MRHFKEKPEGFIKSTKGLLVNLFARISLPVKPGQKEFLIEHQKLIVEGKSEDVLHYHKKTCELFTVEEGELNAFVNGRTLPLKKGDAVLMKPGDKHKMVNPHLKPAKLVETRLNVHEGDRYSE